MKLYDNDSYRDEFMNGVYALLSSDPTSDRANQIIDLFDLAPAVEATAEPSNAPLTLDELRKMAGEPVWIAGADDDAIGRRRPSGVDIEMRLKAEQHSKLRELQVKLDEVLDREPADSGDDEEDYIWKFANDLKNMLDAFFEEGIHET